MSLHWLIKGKETSEWHIGGLFTDKPSTLNFKLVEISACRNKNDWQYGITLNVNHIHLTGAIRNVWRPVKGNISLATGPKIPASLFRITILTVQTLNLNFLLLLPINSCLTKQLLVFRANKIFSWPLNVSLNNQCPEVMHK